MANVSADEKVVRLSDAVVAGTSLITSSALDTQGYENVKFYTLFGAITSGGVQSVKVQQSSDDGSADAYADLLGTSQSVADTDDNKIVVTEIVKPRERYLKVLVPRATQNAVVDGIVAVLSKARKKATSDDSTTVVGREIHVSPAEGTA